MEVILSKWAWVRDVSGTIVAIMAGRVEGVRSPFQVELIAPRHACIIFEADSKDRSRA